MGSIRHGMVLEQLNLCVQSLRSEPCFLICHSRSRSRCTEYVQQHPVLLAPFQLFSTAAHTCVAPKVSCHVRVKNLLLHRCKIWRREDDTNTHEESQVWILVVDATIAALQSLELVRTVAYLWHELGFGSCNCCAHGALQRGWLGAARVGRLYRGLRAGYPTIQMFLAARVSGPDKQGGVEWVRGVGGINRSGPMSSADGPELRDSVIPSGWR